MVQSFQLFYISEDFQNIILKKKSKSPGTTALWYQGSIFKPFISLINDFTPPKEKRQSALFPLLPSITQLPTLSSISHPSRFLFSKGKEAILFF